MLNNIIIQGNITREVELKQTTNGINVCKISVAVNRNYKNADGQYTTDFIDCVAYRGVGEFIARNFKKGSQIIIEGSVETRTYEKDGTKHKVYEIRVDNAYFCGKAENPQFVEVPDDQPLPF